MATILSIKSDNNTNIRIKTLPSSILKTTDANMRDAVADELRDRGVIRVAATSSLATTSKENTKLVLVAGVGLFEALSTGASADNDTTFASADSGWLWNKIADVQGSLRQKFTITGDYTYTLASGYMIDKIMMKPSASQTVKVGLTVGGDEIMLQDTIASGQWRSVTDDVFAEGGPVSVYFSGFTVSTDIIIYKRKL